ncbi:MAG: hypothetical protein JSV63_00295 [Candidatus Aenigmatarchaeota archaeon]|nr:MAG: hypothetical protein JSV63_00295 [Candidatus Aenigmarchaeota archaeon]
MKAQAAFEYMLVVILVLAFLVPLWTYMLSVNKEASDELSLSYAKNAVESITSAADLVYSQGPPAKVRITVFIPDGVEEVNITNRTVNFRVAFSAGVTGIFALSRARLNGTIPTKRGTYWLEIEAIDHVDYDINIQQAS